MTGRSFGGSILFGAVALSTVTVIAQRSAPDAIGVSARVIRPVEIVSSVTPEGDAMIQVSNADGVRISTNGAAFQKSGDGVKIAREALRGAVVVTVEY